MKHLLPRLRHVLGLVLLFTPLAWAVTFSGLSVQIVKQLSFDTRTLQPGATAPDQLVRSVGDGPYTLAARSPYSRGAITYSSTTPAVASVDPASGRVTPLSVGRTTLIATQAALAPYPAATAQYTLELTGTQVSYAPWSLPARTFGQAPFELSATPPTSTPAHPAPITYSTTTPDIVGVTPGGTVTLLKAGSATILARQGASGNFSAGEVSTTLQVNAATPTLGWSPQSLRLAGPALTLQPPSSNNTDPGATFSYTVADATLAEVVNGNQVRALKAGTTTLTATQAAAGNYLGGSVTANLTVLPAQVTLSGLVDLTRTIDPVTPANNQLTLAAQTQLPAGSAAPAITYSSSDIAVASVSGNVLTLVGVGQATLTATLAPDANGQHEGASVTASVTVNGADPGLGITFTSAYAGGAAFAPATTSPSNGALTVEVIGGAGTVATVINNQIVPLAAGTARLRVTQAASGLYAADVAEADLTVLAPPAVTLSIPAKTYGDAPFTPTVTTESNGARRYSSSNTAVATVDANTGQITIVGAGQATIALAVEATAVYPAVGTTAVLQVAKRDPLLVVTGVPALVIGGNSYPFEISTRSSGQISFTSTDPSVLVEHVGGINWIYRAGWSLTSYTTISLAEDANHLAASRVIYVYVK